MFVRSSSVTMAFVFLVATCAMDIVHAVMEATNETVVSVHDNTVSRCVARIRAYWTMSIIHTRCHVSFIGLRYLTSKSTLAVTKL